MRVPRGVLAAVMACASARLARADGGSLDVGASFLVASTTSSMSSGGMLGGSVDLVRWFGRVGLVGEAGIHSWDPHGDARWIGAGARLLLVDGYGPPQPGGGRAGGRIWIEAGVAEKTWHEIEFEGSPIETDAWYRGPRVHAGLGVDFVGKRTWLMGMSMWFRVERGPTPDFMAAPPWSDASSMTPIPPTDLVMGTAFYFGGPI